MDNLLKQLPEYIQENYSEEFTGRSLSEVTTDVASVLAETSDDFTENSIDAAIQSVYSFYCSSDQDLALYDAIYSAETELGVEFSEDDINDLQSEFSQVQYSDADCSESAYALVYDYLTQDVYSGWSLSSREKQLIGSDIKSIGENLQIHKKRSRLRRFYDRAIPNWIKPPKSRTKAIWDTSKDIVDSPMGRVIGGIAIQRGQINLNNRLQRELNKNDQLIKSYQSMHCDPLGAVNDMFSESSEMTQTTKSLEVAPLINELELLPINTVTAEPDRRSENDKEFIHELNNSINLHATNCKLQNSAFCDELYNITQDSYSLLTGIWKPRVGENTVGSTSSNVKSGNYFGNKDGRPVVGTLGTGTEYRAWRANLPRNSRGGIKFETGMLTGAMVDAITEGLLAGTYYQSLDTGLDISSGTIKRGYKGLKALITPTLDKVQEKLEKSGNSLADWAVPAGPSPADIMDGDNKDAAEVIKVLDQTNFLNKLPEQARTLLLINLSKSGICYIDEKGTLTKRTIVDKLINTYQKDKDEFLEMLPSELENIKDLYSKNSLISKESINTDNIYNRLKTAISVDQVRQILIDELNVIKKPLVSLDDLASSISNDFIMLMKSDQRQFKYIINRIARDVEVLARKNGEDSLSAISRSFLRNLAASSNEVDVKRTVQKLIIANIKYLNDLLDVKDSRFAEDLEISGANVNIENSPVKSTGGRTNIVPSNIGSTAGWTEAEQIEGDLDTSTDSMGNAIDRVRAPQSEHSEDLFFTQTSFTTSQACDKVSAPGFGVDAYLK